MRLAVTTIEHTMRDALTARHIEGSDADLIVDDFLGAELSGKRSHGLLKFLLLDSVLAERQGSPRIVKETRSAILIDGQREVGQLAVAFAADAVMQKARSEGIAFGALVNYSRYGRLAPIGRRFAEAGFVGIVMNGGGPAAVVPYGGIEPILGTNPICFGIPAASGPLVIDFATSERAWGEIRQAAFEHHPLPLNAFLDSAGNLTQDPSEASSILPFGGAKGFGLCLAVEILAGALITAKMGDQVETEYDLGALLIAVEPNTFTAPQTFGREVQTLIDSIKRSRPADNARPVSVPGERSEERRRQALSAGEVDVDDELWTRLSAMSGGAAAGLVRDYRLD